MPIMSCLCSVCRYRDRRLRADLERQGLWTPSSSSWDLGGRGRRGGAQRATASDDNWDDEDDDSEEGQQQRGGAQAEIPSRGLGSPPPPPPPRPPVVGQPQYHCQQQHQHSSTTTTTTWSTTPPPCSSSSCSTPASLFGYYPTTTHHTRPPPPPPASRYPDAFSLVSSSPSSSSSSSWTTHTTTTTTTACATGHRPTGPVHPTAPVHHHHVPPASAFAPPAVMHIDDEERSNHNHHHNNTSKRRRRTPPPPPPPCQPDDDDDDREGAAPAYRPPAKKQKQQRSERQRRHATVSNREIAEWPRLEGAKGVEIVAHDLRYTTVVCEPFSCGYDYQRLVSPFEKWYGPSSLDPRTGLRQLSVPGEDAASASAYASGSFVEAAITFLSRFGVDFWSTYKPLDLTSPRDAAKAELLLQRLQPQYFELRFGASSSAPAPPVAHYPLALREQYQKAQHILDALYQALESRPLCMALEEVTDLPMDVIHEIASFKPHPVVETVELLLSTRRTAVLDSWRTGQTHELAAALPALQNMTRALGQFTRSRPLSISKQYKGKAKKRRNKWDEVGVCVHEAYDFQRVDVDQWSALVGGIGPQRATKELLFFYAQRPFDLRLREFFPPRPETRFGTSTILRSRNPKLEIDLAPYLLGVQQE